MHLNGNSIRKAISIVTIIAFIFTNTAYGAPSRRSFFKNKEERSGTLRPILMGDKDMIDDWNGEEVLPDVKVLADRTAVSRIQDGLSAIGIEDDIYDLIPDILSIARKAGVDTAKLSFFACKEALSVVSQDDDFAPQVFLLVPTQDKDVSFMAGFMSYMDAVAKERDEFRLTDEEKFQFETKEVTVKGKKAYLVTVPASRLADKRAVLRWVMDNTQVTKKQVGEGLEFLESYQALSVRTRRQIQNADLEREFLDNIREGARKAKDKYPKLWDFIQHIMDPGSGPTELRLTAKEIIEWGVKISSEDYMDERTLYKEKDDLIAKMIKNAPKATAGYRETINYLLSIDLSKPMNLLIIVFLLNELSEMAVKQAKEQGDVPQAIVAGESRCHTELILESLRRMMAAKGIIVHSPKRGYKVPIGVLSFAAIKNGVMIAAYVTASHAKRFIATSKILGFLAPQTIPFIEQAMEKLEGKEAVVAFKKARTEGAQLLIPQMLELMAGIQDKLNHTLRTGEDFVIKFAAGDDPNISFDINNPKEKNNINVTEQYAQYFELFYFKDQATKDSVTDALARKKLDISYFQSNGASYQFNVEIFKRLFGEEAANNMGWYAIHPDTYLGGTGVSYYNPKEDKDPRIKEMVERNKKELDRFFSDKKVNFSIIADSEILDESGNKKQIVFEVLEKEAWTPIIGKQEMTYITLSNGNLLAYYEKSYYDATQDVSLLEVVMRSYIPAYMTDKKIGHIQMVTDPDGDRHVVLQIEKNDEETKKRLDRLNIAYKVIDDDRLVVVYVPNQSFLMIKEHVIRTLKELDIWNQNVDDHDAVVFFEVSTTVSSITWTDSCTKNGIPIILIPVGYKEIARVLQLVEIQLIRNKIRKAFKLKPRKVIIHNVFGDPIDLGYKPRLLFAGEESGGMSLGGPTLLTSKDKVREFLGWREKSAVEASIFFTLMGAKMVERGEEMLLSKLLDDIYKRNNSVNTAEERWDEVLTDDALLAMTDDPAEVKKIKDAAEERRDYNDGFFCGLAFALGDGKIDLEQAKEILKSAIANDDKALERLVNTREEDLEKLGIPKGKRKEKVLADLYSYIDKITAIRFQGDGTHINFEGGWRLTVRPSGTEAKNKGCPGTNDPYISTLLAGAGAMLNPSIKEVRARYEEVLEELDTEALVGNEGRKLKQYETGLAVDQPVSWTPNIRVQRLLVNKFGKVHKLIPLSDVFIFPGPSSQREPLVYVKETGVLCVSWDFNEQMSSMAGRKAQAGLFEQALENLVQYDTAEEYIESKVAPVLDRLKQQRDGASTQAKAEEVGVIQEVIGALVIAEKLYTPLDAHGDQSMAERFRKGGAKDDGYGVPEGAAIDGSHVFKGNQGYFAEGGKQVFLNTVEARRSFYKRRAEKIGQPIRLIQKPGIGGQHTPYQGIVDVFAIRNPEIIMSGEYELGKDYKDSISKVLKSLAIEWSQMSNEPSSKSGSTDETMMIFVELFYVQLIYAANDAGLDGEKFANLVLNTLHEINFKDGKERPSKDLFKIDEKEFGTDSLIELVYRNCRNASLSANASRGQVKDIFADVIGNMFFETTDIPDKSRLSAFIRNAGLDRELGNDAAGFGAMFENVGGRWTGDLHMMTPLAYYDLDAEAYWNIRKEGILKVLGGKHRANILGNKVMDENITDMALVVPDEFFFFGKSCEQNNNESIWQDGFVNLVTIKQSHWEAQKQHYENKPNRLVINMSDLDISGDSFNVFGIDVRDFRELDNQGLAELFADLFTTFYGATHTIATRLIARALLKEGYTAADVDLNDLDNPATRIVQKNLYLLQPFVELGKGFLKDVLETLQEEERKSPGAIDRKFEVIKQAARDMELKTNIKELKVPDKIADMEQFADVIRQAAEFAESQGRKFVPFIYLEGDKYLDLRDYLASIGYEWIMQGTGDQHISYQQVLAQPQKFLPFIISFVPERHLPGRPAIGFAKGYLHNVSPHMVRDLFADASYKALDSQGGRGLFLRMIDSEDNIGALMEAAGAAVSRPEVDYATKDTTGGIESAFLSAMKAGNYGDAFELVEIASNTKFDISIYASDQEKMEHVFVFLGWEVLQHTDRFLKTFTGFSADNNRIVILAENVKEEQALIKAGFTDDIVDILILEKDLKGYSLNEINAKISMSKNMAMTKMNVAIKDPGFFEVDFLSFGHRLDYIDKIDRQLAQAILENV